MPAWIPITIAAAFLQNVRSALQKRMSGDISAWGATYARFVFALPFAAVYAYATGALGLLASAPGEFLGFAAVGGAAQIAGTVALVAAFDYRNFTVATALSKTETVQAAVAGYALIGERVSVEGWIGIAVSLAGVVAMTVSTGARSRDDDTADGGSAGALLGLASGGAFGVAAVCYRAASLSLGEPAALKSAAATLLAVLALQTGAMTIALAALRPRDLRETLASGTTGLAVGASGAAASAAWFTAMTLVNAAYVRAVGQVELVFTALASQFVFGEKTRPGEAVGVALVTLGIVILALSEIGTG